MDDIQQLKQVPLFSRMDDHELAGVRAIMDAQSFAPGEVIMVEGEVGDHFYVVTDGHVQFVTQDASGHELELDRVGAGGFFGELSMLTGEPRSARVRALTKVDTLLLDRDEFFQFLQKNPHASIDVLTVLGKRLHRTDQIVRQSVSRNPFDVAEERLTLGQRLADKIASLVGSWPFIIVQSLLLAAWMTVNAILAYKITHDPKGMQPWDPYPFILLNLVLSFQAAYTGPIVMMSQNRSSDKDRLSAEIDHQVNTKAEIEIGLLMHRLDDLERSLRHHHDEQCALLRGASGNNGQAGNGKTIK